MLSDMTYLNVRHTLPMLGWQARSFKLQTSMTPAKMQGRRREASANLGATQVRIDIDSYERRTASARTPTSAPTSRTQAFRA